MSNTKQNNQSVIHHISGHSKGVYFEIIGDIVLVLGRMDDNVTSSCEIGYT